jgi:hypothetical protein
VPARFEHEGTTEIVVALTRLAPSFQHRGVAQRGEPVNDDAERLAAGVGVDRRNPPPGRRRGPAAQRV